MWEDRTWTLATEILRPVGPVVVNVWVVWPFFRSHLATGQLLSNSADWGLTLWGWVMHICVSKLAIIDSDNGLSPGQHQAIIWTNAGILLIRNLTNFNEILIEIRTFSLKKMHSSGKWWLFCFSFNVLNTKLIMTRSNVFLPEIHTIWRFCLFLADLYDFIRAISHKIRL